MAAKSSTLPLSISNQISPAVQLARDAKRFSLRVDSPRALLVSNLTLIIFAQANFARACGNGDGLPHCAGGRASIGPGAMQSSWEWARHSLISGIVLCLRPRGR